MPGPHSYLVLPDPLFSRDKIIDYQSGGSRITIGQPVPDSGNQGDLVPYQQGTPTSAKGVDYRLLRTGGLYHNAEWGWKNEGDQSDWYRGQNDQRMMRCEHDPFSSDQREGYGTCILVSEAFQRVIVIRAGPTTDQVPYRYRSLNASDPTSWTSGTYTTLSTVSASSQRWVGFELPDGSMRLFGMASSTDVNLYGSDDGGLTWELLQEDVIETWTGSAAGSILNIFADVSGDWVRFCYIDGTGDQVHTLVSSDRCATWEELANCPSGGTVFSNGDTTSPQGDGACPVGVGTTDGLFLMYVIKSGDETNPVLYSARRNEDWVEAGVGNIVVSNNKRVTGCRSSTDVWFLFFRDFGDEQCEWKGVRYLREDPTDSDNQIDLDNFPGFNGTMNYTPVNIRMAGAGAELLVLHGLNSSGTISSVGTACFSLLGWTQRTISDARLDSSDFWDLYWTCLYGSPTASADSPYGSTTAGSVTTSATPDRLRIVSDGAGDAHYYHYNEGTSPSAEWASTSGSVFTWVMQVPLGPGIPNANTQAVRWVGGVAGTTSMFDVSFRVGMSEVRLYDNIAASTIAGSGFGDIDLDGKYYRFIAAFQGGSGAANISLACFPEGDQEPPQDGGPHNLSVGTSAMTTHQAVFWGNVSTISGASGITTHWRSFSLKSDNDYDQVGWSNPDSLRGRTCDPNPVPVTNSISTRWGGAGGFVGDTFSAPVQFVDGFQALFRPSPRMYWQSGDPAGNFTYIDFDADPDDGVERFHHTAFAVFGTSRRTTYVKYASNSAFSANVTAVTIDTAIGEAVLSSVDGVEAELPSSAPFRAGELAGMYLQVSTPGASAYETAIQITKHSRGRWIRVAGTSSLSSLNITAGTTVTFYSGTGVTRYGSETRSRYMRVAWDDSGAFVQTMTMARAGYLLPGTTFDFGNVSLSHDHTDIQRPSVTRLDTRGGFRTAFGEGPPRRRIEARMDGDEQRQREELRYLLEELSGYSEEPMALVFDTEVTAGGQNLMLCRLVSEDLSNDNQTWYEDTADSQFRPAGSLALAWEEEV